MYDSTLERYTERALETALPTVFTLDYLVPGVVGEIGEVVGKLAKAERDSWSRGQLQEAVALELGDVAWMTAVLIRHLEPKEEDVRLTPMALFPDPQRLPELDLLEIGSELYWIYSKWSMLSPGRETAMREGQIREKAWVLWNRLATHSTSLCGKPWKAVLQMNLDKLSKRQQNGVLAGSGDHR